MVVLDAAHGGDDPGGRLANGQLEKTATLALSVRLRSLLAARGIAVVTTRESDTTILPEKRAEIANHAERPGLPYPPRYGKRRGRTFVCLFARACYGCAISSPWKTAQAAWVTRSLALAGSLNAALLHSGMNVTLGRTGLATMDSMTCPAVAVEIAPERGPDNAITAEPNDAGLPGTSGRCTGRRAALEWRTDAGRTEGRQP